MNNDLSSIEGHTVVENSSYFVNTAILADLNNFDSY